MPGHDSIHRDRRAVLAAGGALSWAQRCGRQARRPKRTAAKLRIGIIGSGHIGGTVGGLWVKAGHPVLFSSRHPEELKDLVAGLGPLRPSRHGRAGDRIRRRAPHRRALRRAAADRPGLWRGAQGQNRARCLQRRAARDGAIADEVERTASA